MNLVLFLLSFLFSSYAPTAPNLSDGNDSGTTVNPDPGKGKGGKFTGGDFIIGYDTNP